MKRLVILTAFLLAAGVSFAQTDSLSKSSDTVKVGNFIIIKKNKGNEVTEKSHGDYHYDYKEERFPRKRTTLSTNWFIFDLGFANVRDETNYTAAQSESYFKVLRPADGKVNENSYQLNNGKSSNVNIWLFMQKLNVSKHMLNLFWYSELC